MIYLGLIEVIHTHTPQVLSLEKAFLAYNVQSALRLGEARGVALLAAAQAGLRIAEYSPTAIKTAVVGYGRADKLQVQKSVFALLKGEMTAGNLELPVSKDATDALATAICHLNSSRLTDLIRETRDGRLKAVDWSRPRVRSLRNVLPKGTVEHLLAVAKRKGQE
jgi:crossover junction endodeoxyribonuclease RuvC